MGLCSDRLICYMAYLSGLKEKALEQPLCIYHIDHDSRWKKLRDHKSKTVSFIKNLLYRPIAEGSALKLLIRGLARAFYRIFFRFLRIKDNPEARELNTRFLDIEFEKVLYDMLKKKRSYVYNDYMWGLPEEKFKEYIFS